MQPLTGYQTLGFEANPFNSNTAEREPEIAEYAVRPPYLDRTEQASFAGGVFFLEGARGSGKSATRLTVAKKVFIGPGGPLVIPVTSFNVFRPFVKAGLSVDHYATQIAFLTVETLLAWMASLADQELAAVKANIKPNEKLIARFVSNFYLNRADYSRSASQSDTFQLLDTSLGGKATAWAEKRWENITGVVIGLAQSLGKKPFDFDIGDPSGFQKLVEQQKGDGFYDPIYILERAVEVARAFGFTGIVVQVDKVDETDWTGADVAAAVDLILPLMANIALHEIKGLTWTFFVWDEVSKNMRRNHGSKIRFDKIPNGTIVWEASYLTDLVSRRMGFFSQGRVQSLSDISEPSTDVQSVLADLIALVSRSPRQLISALDHILSSHIQRSQGKPSKLDLVAYQQGMNEYALKSLNDSGLLDEARSVARMQLVKFVTKDVQGLIRQSAQTARGRIDKWLADQLIKSCGTRPTGSGRPVDEFEIHDPRTLRVMAHKL
ncbi:MAG: hypothetical protein EON54_13010 [Alcaligenaceae bacterium]|nr:MAG: hypothetical protein EON54_13010 [Alcaligenaceae bacterium]